MIKKISKKRYKKEKYHTKHTDKIKLNIFSTDLDSGYRLKKNYIPLNNRDGGLPNTGYLLFNIFIDDI